MDKVYSLLSDQKALKSATLNRHYITKIEANKALLFGKLDQELMVEMVQFATLYLASRNPMWVTEVARYEADLLKKINGLLGTKKAIKKIKLRFDPSVFVQATENKEAPAVALPLEDRIKLENRKRQESGQKLCPKCEQVYTSDPCCVFCRTALS